MSTEHLFDHLEPVLAADQEDACERLLALARVRASTTEDALPVGVLSNWTVPLLIGPTGTGKAFICREVARRWGDRSCRRWDVSGWTLSSSRSSQNTPEQLQAYVAGNPAGCVVYLAGIDALVASHDYYASHNLAVADEIAQFLTRATARPASFLGRDGSVVSAKVLVVVGGCFAALWGDSTVGGPNRREAWRYADPEPLADDHAVARWLREESSLPASILRLLAPEPLVLRRLNRVDADRLSVRLRDRLPRCLDGLGADEFSKALLSISGWRAVAALIERAWVAGHEPLTSANANDSQLASPYVRELASDLAQATSPELKSAQAEPLTSLLPARLGTRLGIPSNRSRLIAKARRLGLRTTGDVEWLALARGYLLPGEDSGKAAAWERANRSEFSDVELVAALLSPCLEWSEQAICRGAVMLAALLVVVAPESIVYEARRARGELVLRHVAWIGATLHPQHRRWRDLLLVLPTIRVTPAFASGLMPDEAIRRVLSTSPC